MTPAEVCTAPAETMKVRAMPACTTRRDGVHGARAPGSAGMQGGGRPARHAEGWGRPHAHGNAARHVVDDQDAERSGQQRP